MVTILRRYKMLQCSGDINCYNSQEIMCKLVGTSQATCVFLSSFSILLIAIDRYLFIVHPTWPQVIIVTNMMEMTIMVEMIIMVEICFPLSLLMQIDIDWYLFDGSRSYIQKGGSRGCRTPQTILNFPQKDCLRTRKVSRLHCLKSYWRSFPLFMFCHCNKLPINIARIANAVTITLYSRVTM